ncbi:MAG: C-GCAxxG-C-C family protein [Thermodesulfobacteriota bacterium]
MSTPVSNSPPARESTASRPAATSSHIAASGRMLTPPRLPGGLLPRIATCFGGGVGRCKEELCGALSGGIMAVGCLLGRTAPGGSWDQAAAVAADLRSRFAAQNGATSCGRILELLGPQEGMDKRRLLTGRVAGLLCESLAAAEA